MMGLDFCILTTLCRNALQSDKLVAVLTEFNENPAAVSLEDQVVADATAPEGEEEAVVAAADDAEMDPPSATAADAEMES